MGFWVVGTDGAEALFAPALYGVSGVGLAELVDGFLGGLLSHVEVSELDAASVVDAVDHGVSVDLVGHGFQPVGGTGLGGDHCGKAVVAFHYDP